MFSFNYGGFSDIGFSRTVNEDYLAITALPDGSVFAIIADGLGSKASGIQPAAIACDEILTCALNAANGTDAGLQSLLKQQPGSIMRLGFMLANRVLLAYKAANEELFGGFGTCVTAAIVRPDGYMYLCHTGNCRLYIIRKAREEGAPPDIVQISKDMTEAQILVNEGKLDKEQYYFDAGRYRITGGLGLNVDPEISSTKGKIQSNDLLLLTTDGVHYAIRPEIIRAIVLESENCEMAGRNLAEAAKLQEHPDNATAAVIQVVPVEGVQPPPPAK